MIKIQKKYNTDDDNKHYKNMVHNPISFQTYSPQTSVSFQRKELQSANLQKGHQPWLSHVEPLLLPTLSQLCTAESSMNAMTFNRTWQLKDGDTIKLNHLYDSSLIPQSVKITLCFWPVLDIDLNI